MAILTFIWFNLIWQYLLQLKPTKTSFRVFLLIIIISLNFIKVKTAIYYGCKVQLYCKMKKVTFYTSYQYLCLKRIDHQRKWKFCCHLLVLKLFQTWMNFNSCWSPHGIFLSYTMEVINCLVTHILQNIFFMFNRKKELKQVWNNFRMSKWRQNLINE